MSTTTHIHGPYKFGPSVPDRQPPYIQFDIKDSSGNLVHLYLHDAAMCDDLIRAAVAAKDLLLAAQACGDIAEHTRRPCELPPEHTGWHRAGQITWPWDDDDGPARDIVSGDLDAIPANRIGEPGPQPARKPAAEMDGPEIGRLLRTLPQLELENMLIHLSGYSPDGFDAALAMDRTADMLAAQHPAQCQSCGATTVDLDPVHVRATTGIAARTEHYCHDTKACNERRHPALAATIAAVGRPARPKNSGGTT